MHFVCLFACFFRIGSQLFYLYHQLQLAQEVKTCTSKGMSGSHTWMKGPSILLFTHRGFHFTSHAASRLNQEPLSFPWPLTQAHSTFATNGSPLIPCRAPRTGRCSHRYDMGLLLLSRAAPLHINTQPSARFPC